MAPFTVGKNVWGCFVGLVEVGKVVGTIVGLEMTMPTVGLLLTGANVGWVVGNLAAENE